MDEVESKLANLITNILILDKYEYTVREIQPPRNTITFGINRPDLTKAQVSLHPSGGASGPDSEEYEVEVTVRRRKK